MKAIAITLKNPKFLTPKNMKANLIFNLDDYDDSFAHRRCIKAYDMALALNQIQMHLRNVLKKTEDGKSIDGFTLQSNIQGILECHDINLNLLIE
jgi:phosphopentomutase